MLPFSPVEQNRQKKGRVDQAIIGQGLHFPSLLGLSPQAGVSAIETQERTRDHWSKWPVSLGSGDAPELVWCQYGGRMREWH